MLLICTKSKFLHCSHYLQSFFCNVKIAGGAFTEEKSTFSQLIDSFQIPFHPFAKFKQTTDYGHMKAKSLIL